MLQRALSGGGGGSSNQNPLLYFGRGIGFTDYYKRADFDDIASLSGEGTNILTFTFKKSVKGSVDGQGLNNTITGTATFDANPIIEYSNNPPKHNGYWVWNFEAESGQTLTFECISANTQRVCMCVNV